MNISKNKKRYTIAGFALAFVIALLISTTMAIDSSSLTGFEFKNQLVIIIGARAVIVVSMIWFFFDYILKMLDKYMGAGVVVERLAKKKINIVTWYLVFEILMLLTFI